MSWKELGAIAVADSTSGVDADLSKLRVLDAVIKETLRLHGPAPIGTVRYAIVTSHDALHEPSSDDRNSNENEDVKSKTERGEGGRDKKKGTG